MSVARIGRQPVHQASPGWRAPPNAKPPRSQRHRNLGARGGIARRPCRSRARRWHPAGQRLEGV
eukprot:4107481-Lingulodinium_polyedra.AAC.1